jgi:DNA-binding MarR family transcriptional regulator
MPGQTRISRTSPGQAHEGLPAGRGDFFRLLRTSHIFASSVREALQATPLRRAPRSLTPSQARLLRLLCTDGRQPVGNVARVLGISAPAGTRTIDALERLDLVVRTQARSDRRTTLLSPSPAGRAWVRRYERVKSTRLEAALRGFEPEEVEALSNLLERFSISLLRGERTDRAVCLRCGAYIELGCAVGQVRGGCPYQKYRRRRERAADRTPLTGTRSGE